MNRHKRYPPEVRERAVRLVPFIDQHRAALGVGPICKRADRPVDVLRAQGQGIGPGPRTGQGEAGPGAV